MVFFFALMLLFRIPTVAHGDFLTSIGKKLWQDHSDGRCYTKHKVKGMKITRLWNFESGGAFYLPPIVDVNGNISALTHDGALWILSDAGKLIANTEALGEVDQPPLALADGTIGVVTRKSGVFFFNPDGTLKTKAAIERIEQRGGVSTGNTVVVATKDQTVVFIKSDGTVQKTLNFPEGVSVPPLVRHDGTLVVAIDNGDVFTFDAEGRQLATNTMKQRRLAKSMAAGPNGDVAFLAFPDLVYVMKYNGRWRSQFKIRNLANSAPVFVSPKRLAVSLGSFSSQVQFIDTDGSSDITHELGPRNYAQHTPVLVGDGSTVSATKQGDLLFLTSGGTAKGKFFLGVTTATQRTPVALSDGTAVIGWEDGGIYFVHSDGSLLGKFETRDSRGEAHLLALADDRVVVATNYGEILMIKASDKESLHHLVWDLVDCPEADLPKEKKRRPTKP